jgi:hypothetical protein
VDPENRLVADALARRWEAALQALREAEEHDHRRQPANKVGLVSIPRPLRMAFTSRGTSLPTVWHQDTRSRAPRKALWRCLIDTVVLHRVTRDTIRTRLVWRGGAVGALEVPSPVGTLRDLTGFAELEAQIRALATPGKSAEELAQLLTTQGLRSPQRPPVLPRMVPTIRLQHGRLHHDRGPRPRYVPGWLTVAQLATALGVKAHGVYHLIRWGQLLVTHDPATQLSLLLDCPDTLEDFRRLQHGHISHVRY